MFLGARQVGKTCLLKWLTGTGLLHKIYNMSKPAVPLVACQELSPFKLYMNDAGLLSAMPNLKAGTLVNGDYF
jgi:hypothetical protein